MRYTVRIQVIKVYDIGVTAQNEDEAIEKAYELSSSYIEEAGALNDATTDFAEVIR